jgi:hypothetical protein
MTRPGRTLVLPLLFVLAGCATQAMTLQADAEGGNDRPVLLAPMEGQRIGAAQDALCPETEKTCHKIRVEGRVPEERAPFFVVEPVQVSGRMWIQPPIHGKKPDGSFSGLVYLGEPHNGAGESFKIYVFGCTDEDRFKEGEQILQLPKDCLVSDPVEVYRER